MKTLISPEISFCFHVGLLDDMAKFEKNGFFLLSGFLFVCFRSILKIGILFQTVAQMVGLLAQHVDA